MSAEEVMPSVRTYNTLMAVCARAGERKAMLRYFSRIGESGMRPTVESWNVILSYCAKHAGGDGRRQQVEDVLNRMVQAGTRPDVISYSCVAQASCRPLLERCISPACP